MRNPTTPSLGAASVAGVLIGLATGVKLSALAPAGKVESESGALPIRQDGQKTQASANHGRDPYEEQRARLKITERVRPGAPRCYGNSGDEHTHDA